MEHLPQTVADSDLLDYKKLKPAIEKCYQSMLDANLTNKEAQTVLWWLGKIVSSSKNSSPLK